MTAQQQAFIEQIAPGAQSGWIQSGILPSLTIAQAIIESGWGKSGLTAVSNNLFGMKWYGNGDYVTYPTTEWVGGEYVRVTAKFKKYATLAQSLEDHAKLITTNKRYSNLILCADYKEACRRIQADGYATSPTYADTLIKCIENYGLQKYDFASVKLFSFCSGPVTKGDLTAFMNLAEQLELRNSSWEEIE